jgi:general secretion pathway protein A
MNPESDLLFMTETHREAMSGLYYSILKRKGIAVLTGDAGTGKTTILRAIASSIGGSRAHMSVIFNPTLTPSEFLEMALLQFGLRDFGASKAQRLMALEKFLNESLAQNIVPVLVIDEAHKLSTVVLEEVRLLTNYEADEGKLLQLVMIGQNELEAIFSRTDLRQLKQRVAIWLTIRPLQRQEVKEYIEYRWNHAGGEAHELPFGSEEIARITDASQGIPRVINAICDNALLSAFSDSSLRVLPEHLRETLHDLGLTGRFERAAHELVVPSGQVAVPQPTLYAPNGHSLARPTGQPASQASAGIPALPKSVSSTMQPPPLPTANIQHTGANPPAAQQPAHQATVANQPQQVPAGPGSASAPSSQESEEVPASRTFFRWNNRKPAPRPGSKLFT